MPGGAERGIPGGAERGAPGTECWPPGGIARGACGGLGRWAGGTPPRWESRWGYGGAEWRPPGGADRGASGGADRGAPGWWRGGGTDRGGDAGSYPRPELGACRCGRGESELSLCRAEPTDDAGVFASRTERGTTVRISPEMRLSGTLRGNVAAENSECDARSGSSAPTRDHCMAAAASASHRPSCRCASTQSSADHSGAPRPRTGAASEGPTCRCRPPDAGAESRCLDESNGVSRLPLRFDAEEPVGYTPYSSPARPIDPATDPGDTGRYRSSSRP